MKRPRPKPPTTPDLPWPTCAHSCGVCASCMREKHGPDWWAGTKAWWRELAAKRRGKK